MKKTTEKPIDSHDLSSDSDVDAPHEKAPLTTPMGRLIERASYADLIAAVGLLLSVSTAYFKLAPHGHALANSNGPLDASVPDALYFSIVTFTSLGYGDLS